MCHGDAAISRELWDELSGGGRKALPEKKQEKKKHSENMHMPAIWDEMQKLKRQVEEDWRGQGPFDITEYRKVD